MRRPWSRPAGRTRTQHRAVDDCAGEHRVAFRSGRPRDVMLRGYRGSGWDIFRTAKNPTQVSFRRLRTVACPDIVRNRTRPAGIRAAASQPPQRRVLEHGTNRVVEVKVHRAHTAGMQVRRGLRPRWHPRPSRSGIRRAPASCVPASRVSGQRPTARSAGEAPLE